MSSWIVIAIGLVTALSALAFLLHRLLRQRVAVCDPNWFQAYSVDRYRPMLRLLSSDDDSFLAGECGYTSSTLRKARAERRRLFRAYLHNLIRDFNGLHHTARILLLNSEVDRPDLAGRLLRARLTFTWAVMVVQGRLLLHAAGLGPVDVRGLLGSLEGLQSEYSFLVPANAQAM